MIPCKNLKKIILDINFILVGYVPQLLKILSEAPPKGKKIVRPFFLMSIYMGVEIMTYYGAILNS